MVLSGWVQLLTDKISANWLTTALAAVAVVLLTKLWGVTKADVPPLPAPDAQSSTGKRLITEKEVSKHSTADNLWIILQNPETKKRAVYDITAYVEEHPGGQAILNNAGSDSTKGFYGPQHPSRVFDIIEDYYIGDLEQ